MRKPACTCLLTALWLLLWLPAGRLQAQCTAPISVFPFFEDFENSNGNWLAGGNVPSWEWGSPAKPVINSAAGGSRCWVTGGLTGATYNSAEASWLQSPCFDFTSLSHPYIRFDFWWETESRFDGAALQYSIDNGLNWQPVVSEPENCLDSNFYDNSSTVTFLAALGASAGWTGNVQSGSGNCLGGGGSGGWLRVAKTLEPLAGKSRVLFRIVFGAGTQCNDFDGIGFDNFQVGEAPANTGEIEYSCQNRSAFFRYNGPYCPQRFSWDFGDQASGDDNVSTMTEPVHEFSQPGRYRVSVTVSGPENGSFTAFADLYVLGTAVTRLERPGCNNEPTGRVVVTVAGSDPTLRFLWNTVPPQPGDTARNLAAGTYRVEVSADGACPADDSITLRFSKPGLGATVTQPACGNEGGSIQLQVSDGTPPYRYDWTPAVGMGPSAGGLAPAVYEIRVNDTEGCAADTLITITEGTPCTGIFFPSAFTPGKAGPNGLFGPAGSLSLLREFNLQVFNRFGQRVFESGNPQLRWDGRFRQVEQPVGAYVWKARYQVGDNPPRIRSGSLLLLR